MMAHPLETPIETGLGHRDAAGKLIPFTHGATLTAVPNAAGVTIAATPAAGGLPVYVDTTKAAKADIKTLYQQAGAPIPSWVQDAWTRQALSAAVPWVVGGVALVGLALVARARKKARAKAAP